MNRVSLSDAFTKFCAEYDLDFSDLWPLFGDKNTMGLSDVRNRLIHGDPFPEHLLESVFVAKIHLTYMLERTLLALLNWDSSRSYVSAQYLISNDCSIKDAHYHQQKLFEFMTS